MRPVLVCLSLVGLVSVACGKREDPTAGLNTPAAPSRAAAPTPPPAAPTAPTAATAGPAVDPSTWVVSTKDDPAGVARCGGLTFQKPALWPWVVPSMRFRTLQYSVPGIDGASPAELVFSVFIGGDGGGIEMNIQRWVQQFRPTNGVPPRTEQSTRTVDGMKVNLIESEGSYSGMGSTAPKPNYAQLGAIIEAPGRTVYVKLLGPDKTVLGNAEAFNALIDSIRDDAASPGS